MATVKSFFKTVTVEEHRLAVESSRLQNAEARGAAKVPFKRPPGRPRTNSRKFSHELIVAPDANGGDERVPVTGEGPAPMFRRHYTFPQKKKVVDYVGHHGIRPAMRHFGVRRYTWL